MNKFNTQFPSLIRKEFNIDNLKPLKAQTIQGLIMFIVFMMNFLI